MTTEKAAYEALTDLVMDGKITMDERRQIVAGLNALAAERDTAARNYRDALDEIRKGIESGWTTGTVQGVIARTQLDAFRLSGEVS